MRFLAIYRQPGPEGTPPSAEHIQQMGKFIEEIAAAGVLVATEGCMPSSYGARVRRENGKTTVVDGPFTEAKEIIGGFALMECKTKEEVIEWTKRFLEVAGDGESEIRQIAGFTDFADKLTPEMREREERSRAQMAANA